MSESQPVAHREDVRSPQFAVVEPSPAPTLILPQAVPEVSTSSVLYDVVSPPARTPGIGEALSPMPPNSQAGAPKQADLSTPPAWLLTERQIAEQLQVSIRTLQRWRKQRTIPFVTMPGGIIRYNPDVVAKWLQNGCPKPRALK